MAFELPTLPYAENAVFLYPELLETELSPPKVL